MMNQRWTEDEEQVRLFRERMEGAGVSRREFLTMLAAAAATVAGGGVLAGCSSSAGQQGRLETEAEQKEELAAEQVFRTYSTREPTSFDYNKSNLSSSTRTDGATSLFAGLLHFNNNFEVEPWLAERYTVTNDGTVYTFFLRREAKWTNGDPCTAHDFIWSWTRSLDPATGNPYPSYLFDIKNGQAFNAKKVPASELGMRAIDDYTLEVTLEGPRGFFPLMVAYTSALPSHKPSVLKYGNDKWTQPDKIVSNGYMKLQSWEPNKQYVLVRNESFWGPKPKLQKVIVYVMGMESGLLPYENNELDFREIPAQEYKRVLSDPVLSKEMYIQSRDTIWYLAPEVDKPPFDNLKVRQAMSHAIDREKISQAVLQGLWKPAYTLVSPGIAGYDDSPGKKDRQKYDPKLAMELLHGTPYEGGKGWPKVTLTMINRDAGLSGPVVQAIQAMVKENMGLSIELQVQETQVFSQQVYKHENQATMVSWIADYPDPHNFFYPVFGSRQSRRRHVWKDDRFDDLIEKAANEPDQAKRLTLYKQAEQIMDDQVAAIWLFHTNDAILFKPWVKGLRKNKLGNWTPNGNVYRDGYQDYYILKH